MVSDFDGCLGAVLLGFGVCVWGGGGHNCSPSGATMSTSRGH